jgi:hypothetical protein
MKLRGADGKIRRFMVAKNDGDKVEDGQTRIECSREARCLECGESFGIYEAESLRPRFRERTCFMKGRSWMEIEFIDGQIMELKY